MPRKLLRAGFGRAGITDKATKRKIRRRIVSGKKATGLGKLGVGKTQRKIIKENVLHRNKVKTRRNERQSARSSSRTEFLRERLPNNRKLNRGRVGARSRN